MDTPWLHVYAAHKLSQLQRHTLRLTSELTVSKWLSIRNLLLEAFLTDGGREKEARLKLYTPAVTYVRVRRGVSSMPSQSHRHLQLLCSPPGSRMGGRREAEHKSLSILVDAVDAATERKHFSGEL